jgi:hypothetical protein
VESESATDIIAIREEKGGFMPISFHFKPEAKLIVFVHTGKVLNDDFLLYYKSMLEGDLFTTDMNLLIDLRHTDSSPRNRDVLSQFADFVKQKFTDISIRPKVAVIAPRDLSFGLARMYSAFADSIPWDFVVFREVDTALAWLRAPEDLMDDLNRNSQQIIPPDNKDVASDAS